MKTLRPNNKRNESQSGGELCFFHVSQVDAVIRNKSRTEHALEVRQIISFAIQSQAL